MNSPRPAISIVLADDHPVVLHGMASILRSQPDINVVALCGDGIAAAKSIRTLVPDIAVLDISMPGLNGLDVLSGITSEGLSTKVIFLTAVATDSQILTAITRGAKGIMLKDIAKVHLSNIYNKLGVANRTALTALTIVHRDQLDPGTSDVFDTDWKAPDASIGASDPISE
jgi:two-component system, NarL family, nitrate/nitrite response regulator NarL